MSVFGYICGIVHYIIYPFSLFLNSGTELVASTETVVLAIGLFVVFSVLQFRMHRILYNLKLKKLNQQNEEYVLPLGELFDFVTCPHYSCEIMIYFSFAVLTCRQPSDFIPLLWVVVNLSVVASKQFEWYEKRFRTQVKHRQLKRLIPLVW
jgi:3-oxo-5-alpha-steroid 4-dehydrogenase 3